MKERFAAHDERFGAIDRRFDRGSGWGKYGWYAGITNDPERRLFEEHKVDEKRGSWIHLRASSESAAREIEDSLHGKGYRGEGGGGDE